MAKTLILELIWGPGSLFSWVLPLLLVRQGSKLSPYVISWKTNEPNLKQMTKNLILGQNLGPRIFIAGSTSTIN